MSLPSSLHLQCIARVPIYSFAYTSHLLSYRPCYPVRLSIITESKPMRRSQALWTATLVTECANGATEKGWYRTLQCLSTLTESGVCQLHPRSIKTVYSRILDLWRILPYSQNALKFHISSAVQKLVLAFGLALLFGLILCYFLRLVFGSVLGTAATAVPTPVSSTHITQRWVTQR